MRVWTREQYLLFSEAMMGRPMSHLAFELLYWCGLRAGELLALTPASLDHERCRVRVEAAYSRQGRADVVTGPKTRQSVRTVAMPAFLAEEAAEFISLSGRAGGERLFPATHSWLRHEMDRGIREAGFPRIRVHDLRHSHVSLLIDLGFNAVQIAARMGHSSADVTFRYAHMFMDGQKAMAEALGELGGGR